MSRKDRGWYKKDYVREREINWSGWIQGYFYVDKNSKLEDRILVRNYQELYTRDKAINCLGDVENKKGLDIGGGDGTPFSIILASLGAKMYVQDISTKAIEHGKSISRKSGLDVEYIEGDAQHLKFKDESFDFCIATDFFQDITKQQKYKVVKEISRILKPGGQLIIKTPNLTYLKIIISLKRLFNLIRFKSPFIYIAHTRNNPDCEHIGLITFNELEDILEENFFFNIKRVPLLLRRSNLPKVISKIIYCCWPLTEHIIISCNKSIFVTLGNSFAGKTKEEIDLS